MPTPPPRSHAPRYWTTLACVLAMAAVVAGLLTLSAGQLMQGWLMILGGLVLVTGLVSLRPAS